jgi:hypothetical protein
LASNLGAQHKIKIGLVSYIRLRRVIQQWSSFYSLFRNYVEMIRKTDFVFMGCLLLGLVCVGSLSTTDPYSFRIQVAEAQQLSGDITAPSGGNPFGGEKMGTVNVDSDGNETNIVADFNESPGEGKAFEGWLVDAGGSGYKLSLGQFSNGTLNFTQNMINPYTYKNFEVTEEPDNDPDPNAASSIAGFELDNPFGQ